MEKRKNINQVYFDNIGIKYLTETVNKPTSIQYKINDGVGSGSLNRVILNRGLEFTFNENYTARTRILDKEVCNKKFFEINYCINGGGTIHLSKNDEYFIMKKGELSFHTNKYVSDEECYNLDMKNYTGIGICLDREVLKKYFFPCCEERMITEWEKNLEFIFQGKSYYKTEAPQCIVWNIKSLLQYDYEFKDISTLLLCQSKLIEIISKSVSYAISRRKAINLNREDEEYIYKAKDILVANIDSPPTIEELATQCHMNSYKLKKGFRDVFDNTPMGYLREVRMYKSKHLLENTDKTICEIANTVGYLNPSKFTESFKVMFNITPSEYRKVNKNKKHKS